MHSKFKFCLLATMVLFTFSVFAVAQDFSLYLKQGDTLWNDHNHDERALDKYINAYKSTSHHDERIIALKKIILVSDHKKRDDVLQIYIPLFCAQSRAECSILLNNLSLPMAQYLKEMEPDPVEPDPVEPDPVEPDPVEPDPAGHEQASGPGQELLDDDTFKWAGIVMGLVLFKITRFRTKCTICTSSLACGRYRWEDNEGSKQVLCNDCRAELKKRLQSKLNLS